MKTFPTLKTGDTVKVITGADRGKQGKVTQVFPKEERIVIEGVNNRKKNIRTRSARQRGEIIQFHAPIALSNAMLVCPHCDKPTRVRHQKVGDAKKRACAQCHQVIDS